MNPSRLPRLARLLLRVLPANRAEDVVGDLEELHARRVARSPYLAALTTISSALIVVMSFRLPRLASRAGRTPPESNALPHSPGPRRSLPLSAIELKLAVRMLFKQPVITFVAVVAMAVGIGLATAGFTLYDGIVNAKLPFDGGERFVEIQAFNVDRLRPVEVEQYLLFRDNVGAFSHYGALQSGAFNVRHTNDEVESVRGSWITPASMEFLPYRPVLGRALNASDGLVGGPPTVVIRESFWRRRLEGRPSVVGETLSVDGITARIVGVMPDDFTFPDNVELWIALPEPATGDKAWASGRAQTFGILGEGVTWEQAREQLQIANKSVTTRELTMRRIQLVPYARAWAAPTFDVLLQVTITVLVLVLMIIALNVANLILARTAARSTELSVRTALGADRARLVGQVFVEVLVMAAVAAALGLGGAHALLGWIEGLTQVLRPWVSFSPSWKVTAFVIFLTVGTAAVAAVSPALMATRRNTAGELRAGGAGKHGKRAFGRASSVILIAEMALAVALLIAGATMGRAVVAQMSFDLGSVEARALTAWVTLPSQPSPPPMPADQCVQNGFYVSRVGSCDALPVRVRKDRLQAAIAVLPHVLAVSSASALPRMDPPTAVVTVDVGAGGEMGTQTRAAVVGDVSPDYFASLGAVLLSGRPFQSEDYAGQTRVIVNQSFAEAAFGRASPLGRQIRYPRPDLPLADGGTGVWHEIVAVVPNLGLSASRPQDAPGIYLSGLSHFSSTYNAFWITVLTDTNAMAMEGAVRRAIHDVDPLIRMTSVMPLSRVGWDSRAFMGGVGISLITLGVVALLLASAGLYAILAYGVSTRTREIGVRVALGAAPGSVLATVMRGPVLQLGAGVIAGVVLTVALDGLRPSLPEPIPGPEAWMLPVAVSVLVWSGLIASWIPARRALGISPSEAFRAD